MRRQVPRFFAIMLTVIAVLAALAALRLGLGPGRGHQFVRHFIDTYIVPVPANLAYAAFVGLMAGAAARRKQVAWRIMIVFFGLQMLVDLMALAAYLLGPAEWFVDDPITRADWIEVIVSSIVTAIFLALLVWARREFYAKVQKASLFKALLVFGGIAVAGIGLGYVLVRAFGTLPDGETLKYSVEKVLGGFELDPGRIRQGRAPRWVNLVLGGFGAIALLAGFFTLFKTQRKEAGLHGEEEVRIRTLLNEFGESDSLGYFATRRDKSVVFGPGQRAAVTYRPVKGVSLASGDPIGDPDAWDGAIAAWLAHTREYGWRPAVMGASEAGATAYQKQGLKVIELGDEAILHVKEFQLDGRDMRPVRQAVSRIERAGYTARVRRHAQLSEEEMQTAVRLAEQWRDTEAERGFSMALSRLGDSWDRECVLVEALSPDGTPAAMLSFVPWGRTGLSLDLMRRDRSADNGLMEFMVASLVKEAPRLGVERVSLNFAVFRAVFEEGARIGAGPILRAWRRMLLFFSHFWQLESLYRSNVKYHPEWLPRFLCFGERRELFTVGIAAAIAEGFLVLPGQRGHIVPSPPPAGEPPRFAAVPVGAKEVKRPEQVRVRMAKLEQIQDPYPVGYARTHSIANARTSLGAEVSIAGRVMLLRPFGQITFATLRDWSGDIQIMVPGKGAFDVDIGDHVGVAGTVITSKRGETTVEVTSWTLTAKCLQPLPNKHQGLSDPEARVRRRYLDLIVNPSARETLKARSAVIASLRNSLHSREYIEVETPMLQPVHGGANARPFVTHINAYDMRLYLRIAPELYLKRLCIGGVEKVFELGRTFRNEGVSFKHNPEFTMLEAYQAYADYNTMLDLTRSLIQEALTDPVLTVDGVEYDLSGQWPVKTLHGSISEALGESIGPGTPVEQLQSLARKAKVPFDPAWGHGQMVLEMYERLVEHHTTTPTFYKDFPTDVSPLTRSHRDDPRLAERWDLVAFGTELGTAYSELIDPVEQRRRLTQQSLLAAGGDAEAMELDEDFLEALEFAMPPSGGLGIGVDRLVMLLTGKSIRETLPFPLVRPS